MQCTFYSTPFPVAVYMHFNSSMRNFHLLLEFPNPYLILKSPKLEYSRGICSNWPTQKIFIRKSAYHLYRLLAYIFNEFYDIKRTILHIFLMNIELDNILYLTTFLHRNFRNNTIFCSMGRGSFSHSSEIAFQNPSIFYGDV